MSRSDSRGHAVRLLVLLLAALGGAAAPLCAQTPASAVGHWEGAILVPGGELGMNVDLARDETGKWSGDISIPAQQAQDFALAEVSVEGKAVSFKMAGVPGEPTFKGTLSDDGDSITGSFIQGQATLEFRLARAK